MTGADANTAASVTVVSDPADNGHISPLLRRLHDLSEGRACATITPGPPRLHALASDLLAGLLKRPGELTGTERQGQERFQTFLAWLIGERVRDLFIDRAHHIYGRGWQTVCSLAPAYGVRVWLITAEGLSRRCHEVVRGFGALTMDADEFIAAWSPTAPGCPPHEQAFPRVPADDWTSFADTCQRLLDPLDLRVVLDAMHEAVEQTERWLSSRRDLGDTNAEETIGAFLRELVHDARVGDEAVARLRAAQQVIFEDAAYSVKISRRPFLDLIEEARLSPATANMMRGYSSTRHAALGVLQLAVPAAAEDFAALAMRDLAPNGSVVRVQSHEHSIPAFAAGILRAHRIVRLMQAAEPADALFVYETRHGLAPVTAGTVQRKLHAIGRDTGLRLTRHWNQHATSSQRAWLWRRGISVQRLGPSA
jgi:hypothetical protein